LSREAERKDRLHHQLSTSLHTGHFEAFEFKGWKKPILEKPMIENGLPESIYLPTKAPIPYFMYIQR